MGRAAVCAGGRRPAREIATREPDGSEWSISRPALALPPSTGTAAHAPLGGFTCASLGPGVHPRGRFVTWCQSASGVPAEPPEEADAARRPTAMAVDDQKQAKSPARATHTDCG